MQNRISAEIAVAKEVKRILEFDFQKHWKRVFGLYAVGLLHLLAEKKPDFSVGLITREGYLIFRHIDDVLDGDFPTQNPGKYVRALRDLITGGKNQTIHEIPENIVKMMQHSLASLKKRATPHDSVESLFLTAIDAMLFDYDRIHNQKRFLSQEELNNYYFNTFAPVLNLMLIGFKSKLRVTPQFLQFLALAQGHIYSIRDLEKDWKSGIYNIPTEILDKAHISGPITYEKLIQNPHIISWIEEEITQFAYPVKELQKTIQESSEAFTFKAINFSLLEHMLKTLEELQQKCIKG